MQTTIEDVQSWAAANGHDGTKMWPVNRDDLRAWARDFNRELIKPNEPIWDKIERTIAAQPNHYFQQALKALAATVALGFSLSNAMSLFPEMFDVDGKFLTVVRYGEMHGELDETLKRYIEKPEDMNPRCGVKR